MALLAITLGWFIIVPPFISVYNTSLHIAAMEQRAGVAQQISPALNVILLLVVSVGIGIYSQEHLNRVCGRIEVSAHPSADAWSAACSAHMIRESGWMTSMRGSLTYLRCAHSDCVAADRQMRRCVPHGWRARRW